MAVKNKKNNENDTIKNEAELPVSWSLNDRVLCRYPNSEIYYEAKIIGITNKDGVNLFTVHYQGWNSRHDEKISETEASERFKPYTDEDAEKARDVVKKAQLERSKKRKSTLSSTGEIKRNTGEDSSRASTPSRSQTETSRRSRGQSSAAQSTVGEPILDNIRERNIKKIILPNSLRKILTDDHNLINNQHMLPKVPARVTVDEIVQEYLKSLSDTKFRESADKDFFVEHSDYSEDYMINPSAETCEQSALGLLDYFDMTVGSLLMYKFEKPMFMDLFAAENEKIEKNDEIQKDSDGIKNVIRYSKYFGLIHFLRLFTRFTETLAFTQWSMRALDSIVRHAQDFVIFLGKRYADFYDIDQDYVVAPPEYLKRVWGEPNQ